MTEIRIPESFVRMPRWWRDGTQWLDALPQLIAHTCARWHLEITGELMHGSHAVAMMRRLAVPAPPEVRSTAAVAAGRVATIAADWRELDRPFEVTVLRTAADAGARLSRTESGAAVNGDLHSAQVLRGTREPWLTVDPVLLRGDIAFDLARVLWTRLDDMRDRDIMRHSDAAVRAAGIDRDHGRDWVLFRTVDYWLWGLDAGLTEDPQRCRRLVRAFMD